MADNIAIKVEGVYKDFKLPHEKVNTVKTLFMDTLRGRLFKRDYEAQHALRGVDFSIKKGEFFGIVGRNGSGKSTMLKMLAGIYQPTKGKIDVDGKLVPFIELGVGFNAELTGKENVYLNGAMLGFSKKQIDALYPDIVEFAELEKFMDQKLKNYSSGMQVRLAFSMAIRAEADILLVDEVLAVGDADFQRKCFEYFRKLKKNKKTVVFVSHDMSAVREYCDRAILIDNGKVKSAGSSEKVAKDYTRMFIQETNQSEEPKENSKKKSWGTGSLKVEKIKVSKKTLTDKDPSITVHVTIKVLKNFEYDIVPGITVKNQAGQPVCGTNSKIMRAKTIAPKKGKNIVVEWQIPNIFNDGLYTIDFAIAEAGNMEICQWIDDAVTFRVIEDFSTPYIVNPKFSLKIGKE